MGQRQWHRGDRRADYRRENYGRGADPPRDDRGGYDSYDERRSQGRDYGQGRGWYGNPREHAEAARERWQESHSRAAKLGWPRQH